MWCMSKRAGDGGCSGGRGHMITCHWFMLMDGRNWHNTVKQLFCNKTEKIKWWNFKNITIKIFWEELDSRFGQTEKKNESSI